MSQKLFPSFFSVAINFVGRLHSQGPIYPTSDVYNAIYKKIPKWVEFRNDSNLTQVIIQNALLH